MPRIFRVMRKDGDNKPSVGQGYCQLGVRLNEIDMDEEGNAIKNHKGMSVSPAWQVSSLFVLPKRLGTGGRGKDNGHCFRRGTDKFQQGPCGNGLELLPDSVTHGVVRPAQVTPITIFLQNLANTRDEWEIDET
ncbi:hypothetical protein BH10PLA2_BH10PLA2_14360 [soil metagenome]